MKHFVQPKTKCFVSCGGDFILAKQMWVSPTEKILFQTMTEQLPFLSQILSWEGKVGGVCETSVNLNSFVNSFLSSEMTFFCVAFFFVVVK